MLLLVVAAVVAPAVLMETNLSGFRLAGPTSPDPAPANAEDEDEDEAVAVALARLSWLVRTVERSAFKGLAPPATPTRALLA